MELFGRAIQQGDEIAWENIYSQYQPLLQRWVELHPLFESTQEESQYFANWVLAKSWREMSPEEFRQLPDFQSMLRYLQMCVHSAFIDFARGHAKTVLLDEYVDPASERESLSASEVPPISVDPGPSIEERAYIPSQAEKTWEMLRERVQNEHERKMIYGRYVLALNPEQIQAWASDLFENPDQVVSTIDHFLDRLVRDPEVRDFLSLDEVDFGIEYQLTGTLYRAFCPESIEIGEYHLGMYAGERADQIQRHLKECPFCTRELDQLQAYLEIVARYLQITPVNQARNWIALRISMDQFQKEAKLNQALQIAQPGAYEYPLIYQAGEAYIMIQQENDPGSPDRMLLRNHVVGIDPDEMSAYLWSMGNQAAATEVEENGLFIFLGLEPGTYELILTKPQLDIYVQELVVD
jgi:hypothetical protein